MPVMDRKPINIDNDDEHHKNVMHRQGKNDQNYDTSKIFMSLPIGSTAVVQQEHGGSLTHGTIIGKVITVIITGHTRYKSPTQEE